MLYVSTRSNIDSFTAYRTLHEDNAQDGGMFVPMRFPTFSEDELNQMKAASFGETVAKILNLFFSANLSGWDIDSCAGRHPLKLVEKSHKLIIAELWHNHELNYDYLERKLFSKLCAGEFGRGKVTAWARIAIRIAVLCGIWGEIMNWESSSVDIAVMTEDFSVPMSIWYAKKMGLPIGRIICACQDNGQLWDLVHRGVVNVSASQNLFAVSMERLIYDVFGLHETKRFLDAVNNRRSYHPDENKLTELSDVIFASVIEHSRTDYLASSIYRSCGYVADTSVALSFGGLQNYRAKTGCSNVTVLFGMVGAR